MSTYTLTLDEAETQFRQLVQRTQTTHQPIVITSEENAKPMAVMIEMAKFEQSQRDRQRLFHLQCIYLSQWLDRAEQDWQNEKIRQACVNTWKQSVKPLWDACPEEQQGLCASLRLAVKQLEIERFSLAQVAALRGFLELLRDTNPSQDAVDAVYQKLITSGLPPALSFDKELVKFYIDDIVFLNEM